MLDPEYRFFITGSEEYGETMTAFVLDWDQRKEYVLIGPESLFPEGEDREIDIVKRYMRYLGADVHTLTVDEDGSLVSASSDPKDDQRLALCYPNYADVPSLSSQPTIDMSCLVERDRITPGVDIVEYGGDLSTAKKSVFKYCLIFQWRAKIWNELQVLKTIPQHPNLVNLDKVVLANDNEVVGFTTSYIDGGTFEDNKNYVFRLEWLRQLTGLVDYLNLELGIVHQDIAPRNLLLDLNRDDPSKNSFRLFDFDMAASPGGPGHQPHRNDVNGVVYTAYEIITDDYHFRNVRGAEWDLETLFKLDDWPPKRTLDQDVTLFRQHLKGWVHERQSRLDMARSLTPRRPFNITEMPAPRPILVGYDDNGIAVYEQRDVRSIGQAMRLGQTLIPWQRPPFEEAYPSLAQCDGHPKQ